MNLIFKIKKGRLFKKNLKKKISIIIKIYKNLKFKNII